MTDRDRQPDDDQADDGPGTSRFRPRLIRGGSSSDTPPAAAADANQLIDCDTCGAGPFLLGSWESLAHMRASKHYRFRLTR